MIVKRGTSLSYLSKQFGLRIVSPPSTDFYPQLPHTVWLTVSLFRPTSQCREGVGVGKKSGWSLPRAQDLEFFGEKVATSTELSFARPCILSQTFNNWFK